MRFQRLLSAILVFVFSFTIALPPAVAQTTESDFPAIAANEEKTTKDQLKKQHSSDRLP